MMGIKALGSHTLDWLFVGSDEGEWMLEARVPAVCEDEVSWRRVSSLSVQWAVPEYSGVMHRPRPAHIHVQKAALMVTDCLQNDGGEQLPVHIALTIRAAWWLYPDMAAVDRASSFRKRLVSCQPCKPPSYCCQVLCSLWEVDDLLANGHHLLSNSVDSGARHPKHP